MVIIFFDYSYPLNVYFVSGSMFIASICSVSGSKYIASICSIHNEHFGLGKESGRLRLYVWVSRFGLLI